MYAWTCKAVSFALCAPEMMPASCVFAPTSCMIADREKEPVVV